MKKRILKNFLVYLLVAAMLIGDCSPVFASVLEENSVVQEETATTATEQETETEEEIQDETLEETPDTDISDEEVTEPEDTVVADDAVITKEGNYTIQAGTTGTITVSADNVTLVGNPKETYEELFILCTKGKETLTLKDISLVPLKVELSIFDKAESYTVEIDDKTVCSELELSESTTILYIYTLPESHTLKVNGQLRYVSYDETDGFNVSSLAFGHTGEGSIFVSENSNANPKEGVEVAVTATPAAGYYLAQIRYAYPDGEKEGYGVVNQVEASENAGTYTFTMPAEAAYITADFVSVVWDGTIDVTWYDETADEYFISYPAQMAAIAALDNGLFNDYPMKEEDGNPIPNTVAFEESAEEETTEYYLPYGYNKSCYNLFKTEESGTQTAVVGDITYLKAYCSAGGTGSNNQITTNDYWYGPQDFNGKIIRLTNDLDMGGYCSSDKDRTEVTNWSGPNYMPIGGQYLMHMESGFTHLGSSFNGTLNGQGYVIYNVYCNRRAEGNNYGDSASVGIIGRMGVHDNDSTDLYANPVVKNLAVDGIFYGRRHTGGIVGKNGKSNGSLIENCVNFATVKGTDAKGASGIIGAGWNKLDIKNCVNFGHISTSYDKNAGGISGSCEANVYNCYNFGYVGTTNSNKEAAQALGTNNGGAIFINCYWLTGSSAATKNPAVYGSNKVMDSFEEVKTPEEMKTDEFLLKLCGTGRSWVSSDIDSIKSSYMKEALINVHSYGANLEAYDVTGMPVPRTFTNDSSNFLFIKDTFENGILPKTEYVEGQTFNADEYKIYAIYDDGTKLELEDYTITYGSGSADAFSVEDTTVTIEVTFEEKPFSRTFEVTVVENELKKLEISKEPANIVYAAGEYFNPSGMIVKATYTNGKTVDVTEQVTYNPVLDKILTVDVTAVTVSYTYKDITLTDTVSITVLEESAPDIAEDKVVQIETASDLLWFANQINIGEQYNAILLKDIDMSSKIWTPIGNSTSLFTGAFNGNNKRVTFQYEANTSRNGLFGYVGEGALVQNVIVDGTISGGNYTAGIVGRMNGGEIKNCVNEAVISQYDATAENEWIGGIVGCLDGTGKVTDCVNKGEVSGYHLVGGITGQSMGANEVTGCKNYAAMEGGADIGGILGGIGDAAVLKDCKNAGTVTATIATSIYTAGGIVGVVDGEALIQSCHNGASVTGSAYLGGIAGKIIHSDAIIKDCYNTGNITLTQDKTEYRAGGLTGFMNAKAAVENCYTTGVVAVKTENNTAVTNKYFAGFIGYAKESNLDNVMNNYVLAGVSPKDGTTSRLVGAASSVTAVQVKEVSTDEMKEFNIIPEAILLIQAIGTVELSDEAAIQAARKAYNALTEEEKLLVSDEITATLTAAESKLAQLKEEAAAQEALKNQQAAKKVETLINAIGTVSATSGKAIQSARQAYNALTATQKPLVANASELATAEAAYASATTKLNASTSQSVTTSCNAENFSLTAKPSLVTNAFTYTYQWYNTDAKGANAKVVGNGSGYSPKFTAIGTFYYECRITANDGVKTFAAGTNKFIVKVNPQAVTIKSAENTSSAVKITWNKSVGAKGYYVYRRKGSGKWELIKTIKNATTVSYTDTKVKSKNGTKYSYKVVPYNGSTKGDYGTVTIIRLTKTTLSSVKNSSKKAMTVKWKKNSKASGYQIQYSTSSKFSASKTKTVTVGKAKTVSKKITKLTKKKTYYVRVRAYKKSGSVTSYSAWSSKKKVTIKK